MVHWGSRPDLSQPERGSDSDYPLVLDMLRANSGLICKPTAPAYSVTLAETGDGQWEAKLFGPGSGPGSVCVTVSRGADPAAALEGLVGALRGRG